jgi:hypothetical protein
VARHLYVTGKDLAVMIASDAATLFEISKGEALKKQVAEEYNNAMRTQSQYRKHWKDILARVEESKKSMYGQHVKKGDWKNVCRYIKMNEAFVANAQPSLATFEPIVWQKLVKLYQDVMKMRIPMFFENDLKIADVYYVSQAQKIVNQRDYEWIQYYLVPQANALIVKNVRTWQLPISGRGIGLAAVMKFRVLQGNWRFVQGKSLWDIEKYATRNGGWVGWAESHPLGIKRAPESQRGWSATGGPRKGVEVMLPSGKKMEVEVAA